MQTGGRHDDVPGARGRAGRPEAGPFETAAAACKDSRGSCRLLHSSRSLSKARAAAWGKLPHAWAQQAREEDERAENSPGAKRCSKQRRIDQYICMQEWTLVQMGAHMQKGRQASKWIAGDGGCKTSRASWKTADGRWQKVPMERQAAAFPQLDPLCLPSFDLFIQSLSLSQRMPRGFGFGPAARVKRVLGAVYNAGVPQASSFSQSAWSRAALFTSQAASRPLKYLPTARRIPNVFKPRSFYASPRIWRQQPASADQDSKKHDDLPHREQQSSQNQQQQQQTAQQARRRPTFIS